MPLGSLEPSVDTPFWKGLPPAAEGVYFLRGLQVGHHVEISILRPISAACAEDIRYTLGLWPGLIRFLEDGTLEPDTNPIENEIRPVALTKKNALFAGNKIGAENVTIRRGPRGIRFRRRDEPCSTGQSRGFGDGLFLPVPRQKLMHA